MSEEQTFTPGPWVAIAGCLRWHGSKPIFTDGLWHILPETDVERLPICAVDHADDHDEVTRKRAEGDARLIAAAPELYEALAELMAAFGGVATHAQQAKWDKAKAVLAKVSVPRATTAKSGA